MATAQSNAMFQNHTSLPIAIIGGGMGGLALAIGLVKHGVKVHVYEAAAAFAEIGAGVAFGVNATTALHLLDPRLLEGYKKHATFNADPARASTFYTMRWGAGMPGSAGHAAGDFICHLDDIWHSERAEMLGVKTRSCIHRARLLEELVALLPEGITTFGKSFQGAEESIDGSYRIEFTDGTTVEAAAIIGCDGIKSKVRELVCPSVQASYAREWAYRAVVPKADALKALGPDLALNGQIYCGHGGYIVTYPIENGDFINMVAIPHQKADSCGWGSEDWTVPATTSEILQRFAGWYPPLVDLISRNHLPSKWAMFHLQHDRPFYNHNICLLGDSAHATVPHLAAGAGMAMEDAYILSNLIASSGSIERLQDVFRAYDVVRRPRTQDCIKASLQASCGYCFSLPGVGDDVTALKKHLEQAFRWLWHVDLEAQLATAKTIQAGGVST
ncbi:mannitol 1-phosphate dehydrogenase [Paraphoma chrysanthemicola]|uniref:Mannitol 1-phosphate dehydrogenase n=1 Tax=Paraphoma chrysanthemicola TaxID=798071 RepID=A0A8K0QTB6_9PLEO|nr:mannitol 1-phosphate dehydrogenase [Paraphoma chrysanthemicola]